MMLTIKAQETELENGLRLAMIDARQCGGRVAMFSLLSFMHLAVNEGQLLATAMKVAEGHGNGWAVDRERMIAFRKWV